MIKLTVPNVGKLVGTKGTLINRFGKQAGIILFTHMVLMVSLSHSTLDVEAIFFNAQYTWKGGGKKNPSYVPGTLLIFYLVFIVLLKAS